MANPRPLSIVKIKDSMLTDTNVEFWGLTSHDRFVYYGEIAQDPTRCIVVGLYCGKRVPYLSPDIFEEADITDF
jgi:hypothetical protein